MPDVSFFQVHKKRMFLRIVGALGFRQVPVILWYPCTILVLPRHFYCFRPIRSCGYPGATPPFFFRGLFNAKTPAGNSGWYEWWIRLPKKPSGEINIVIQCGVVKPNAFAVYDFDSVLLCAAETGERIGAGTCVRQEVDPGVSPVVNTALPKITATAYPGPYNAFTPICWGNLICDGCCPSPWWRA